VWGKIDRYPSVTMDGWANRPFGSRFLPPHMMLGLVRNDTKYVKDNIPLVGEESQCFLFDYSRGADQPDPAGCGIFSKTFAPLKELRNCIVEHLDQDSIWSNRKTTVIHDPSTNFSGPYTEWCPQAVWGTVGGGASDVQLCSASWDSHQRAQEMIKLVLFKPLPDDSSDAAERARNKIQFTTSWPKGQESVTHSTASAIQEKCFRVRDAGGLEQAHFLQKISVCLPLMFDKAEVQGFGLNDGLAKFQSPNYGTGSGQNLRQAATFPVPPACGRLALAAIPGFQKAKYMLAGFDSVANGDAKVPFGECIRVGETNCRKAYFCWERALNRICGMSPACCPLKDTPDRAVAEASRLNTHEACKTNPDGKLVNIGTSSRWTPESFFGMQLRCPKKMGTGSRFS